MLTLAERDAILRLWEGRPREGQHVVIAARRPSAAAKQIARLPAAREGGRQLVACVVPAAGARRMIDVEYRRGAELDRHDLRRCVVVLLSDDDVNVEQLGERRQESEVEAPSPVRSEQTKAGLQQRNAEAQAMKSAAKRTTAAPQQMTVEAAPERAPRKKKRSGERKFGKGTYGITSKRSAAETIESIRRLMKAHDCRQFAEMSDSETGINTISFRAQGQLVRFQIVMPREEDLGGFEKCFKNGLREITKERVEQRLERLVRARYRALFLAIKARLVMIQAGISDFTSAFLPEIVDEATGRTVGDLVRERQILPQLAAATTTARLNGAARAEARA